MRKQIIIGSRYHVIRKIGEGGMAKVYLSYDNILEKNVALKVLRKENVQEKKIKHFKREANALSMMEDENIVRIHDVGEEGDIHYIVNEYVEGMTLKEYIATCSPLPVEEVIEITRQTLSGLHHAHNRGVVHKDIKSQNILLNENKDVKITDFGIADIMDDDVTKTQSVMGTPQYVAPEILNREELTEQSDIYSVGILMYEMLAGRAPFTGEKPAVIMIKQMNHPMPSVREERSDCPQSLENIIIKAAAKTLENRYKTCEDMLFDLETVLEEERVNEKKLLLKDDFLTEESLEKDVSVKGELSYKNIIQDSEKAEMKKKQRKVIIIALIPTVIILVALIIIFSKDAVVMPDFLSTETQQTQAIDTLALKVPEEKIKIITEPSDTLAEGVIINSEPAPGAEILPNTMVILTVSAGKETIYMENLVDKFANSVTEELTTSGFNVIINTVESEKSEGVIIGQTPKADEELSDGDDITLDVSSGVVTLSVPNFTNVEGSEAVTWGEKNNININTISECSNVYGTDRVITQKPAYNSEIKTGNTLTITVSTGNCPVETKPEPTDDKTPAVPETDSKKNFFKFGWLLWLQD